VTLVRPHLRGRENREIAESEIELEPQNKSKRDRENSYGERQESKLQFFLYSCTDLLG
jgi:hypothetical protein